MAITPQHFPFVIKYVVHFVALSLSSATVAIAILKKCTKWAIFPGTVTFGLYVFKPTNQPNLS